MRWVMPKRGQRPPQLDRMREGWQQASCRRSLRQCGGSYECRDRLMRTLEARTHNMLTKPDRGLAKAVDESFGFNERLYQLTYVRDWKRETSPNPKGFGALANQHLDTGHNGGATALCRL